MVTLNRPEKLNAWTPVMGGELLEAFRRVDRDPEVRVAIFTGAGERAFCAGADMDFFAAQIAAGGGTGSRGGGGGGPSRVEDFPHRDAQALEADDRGAQRLRARHRRDDAAALRRSPRRRERQDRLSLRPHGSDGGARLDVSPAAHRRHGARLRADAHRQDVRRRRVRAHGTRQPGRRARRPDEDGARARRRNEEVRTACR